MQISRARKIAISLLVIFFMPMISAHLLYYFKPKMRTINNGTLVQPTIPLIDYVKIDNPSRKWKFMYMQPQSCGKICQNDMAVLRQVRLALGKDINRVERYLVQEDLSTVTVSAKEHPDLKKAHIELKDFLALASKTKLTNNHGLYLVDTRGDIMMYYGTNLKPKPIYKDLQRLLKYT